MVIGFEGVHYQLSGGKVFHAPTRDEMTLRREREEMETFGGRRYSKQSKGKGEGPALESWRIVDDWQLLNQSAGGLRIARSLVQGVRIGAGQLIATRPHDAGRYSLASIRWALREPGDALAAGIQVFPGEPQTAAVRVIEANGKPSSWRPAFMLPEIGALRIPASVVLPAGSFRLDRKVEVMVGDEVQVLKLFRVLDHGAEFERCSIYAQS